MPKPTPVALPAHLAAEMVPIDSCTPLVVNPRRGDVDFIRGSVERFGQYAPIILRRGTREILKGNHTWHALKAEGVEHVAVLWRDVASDDDAQAFALRDNRASDLAGYDPRELADTLQALDTPLQVDAGYDLPALEQLLEQAAALAADAGPVPDPPAPDPPRRPTTKAGDLILLGDHRLLCGDTRDPAAVKKLLAGGLAQLCFTDPPYGVDYDGGTKVQPKLAGDQRGTDIYVDTMKAVAAATDQRAPLYLWHAGTLAGSTAAAVEAAGYEIRSQIIWTKNQAQFGALTAQYKQQHEPCFYAFRKGTPPRWHGPNNEVTVWEADRASVNEFHPTQKPTALAARAIANSSLPGELVLDLFGGSGSTLIAAEHAGRPSCTMELDPGYCDVIVARWEAVTGRKARRTKRPAKHTRKGAKK